ncbi:DMT family transporter [Neptunomonas japonica]|uniref:DMT family transporter n=1 Tax=Neptunomonas japonica TaxID=417574 RepID=UPI001FE009C8|nr:DMT family transporter [Neptunomonas japonica]
MSTRKGALLVMTNNFTDNSIYKGALLILLSELFLVFSGMVIKQISGELPTEIIVFIRNLFGLMLLMPWLLKNGTKAIRTNLLRFHFMRAAVGVTAMSCLYYSWGHLPLAQAALLKQTAPFFMPLIALYWLGENISGRAKLAILVGFVGVYIVLNPHEGSLNFAVIIAVVGAMLGALAKVTIRRMVGTESPQRIVFYFAFFSALLSAIPALLVWQMPTTLQFSWLLLLASTSTVAQLLLSKGYSYAPAGQLGPFTYGSVAFAALFGWWIWAESLGWNTWVGMVLITLAGLMAMLKKRDSVRGGKN